MNVKDFKPRPPLLHCGFNQRPSNVHMLEYFFMLGTWDALKRSLKLAPLTPYVGHTWVVKKHAISKFNDGT